MLLRSKKSFLCLLVASLLSVWTGTVSAAAQRELDLRAYIAKFSKNGDDTEAFRQAFADLGKYHLRFLRIPPGTYHLSDTINISGISNGEILGQGFPEIKMKDPKKDIFSSAFAWQLKIEGLVFYGGKNQLSLSNNNIDRAHIQIVNCKFKDASGFAIWFGDRTISTRVEILRCSFCRNMQTLRAVSDGVKLADSWITTHPEMIDKAVIENLGWLTLDHVLGVPLVPKMPRKEAKQRWIDNRGLKLTCRDTRFGGEGGGFAIVYNYRKFSPKSTIRSTLTLSDCWLYCAGTQAIRLFEVPNMMIVENCTGLIDTLLTHSEPTMNLSEIAANPKLKHRVLIRVRDNAPTIGELPELLRDVTQGPFKFIAPAPNK